MVRIRYRLPFALIGCASAAHAIHLLDEFMLSIHPPLLANSYAKLQRSPGLGLALYALLSIVLIAVICSLGSRVYVLVDKPLVYTNDHSIGANPIQSLTKGEEDHGIERLAVYQLDMGGMHHTSMLHIRPNGCVEKILFNGEALDISTVGKARCNPRGFFALASPANAARDRNYMVLQISNHAEQYRPVIYYASPPHQWLLLLTMGVVIVAGLFFYWKQSYALTFTHLGIITIGLCLWYLFSTLAYHSGVDVKSHLFYIEIMERYNQMPSPRSSWQGHHPPLYYWLGSMAYSAGKWWDMVSPINAVRLLSVGYFSLFLGYGLLMIWQLHSFSTPVKRIGTLLLLFWPLGIMGSTWVDSNVLWWALGAGCYAHMLYWSQSLDKTHLRIALIFAAIAIITRSNAYMLLPFIMMVYAALVARRKIALGYVWDLKIIACIVLLLGAVGVNSYRAIEQQLAGKQVDVLVGKHAKNLERNGLLADNDFRHYLTFDFVNHIKTPYNRPHSTDHGRDNFWSALLKTSLFSHTYLKHVQVATLLSYLLLGFCLLLILPLAWYGRQQVAALWVPWLYMLLSIAALMFLRWYIPTANSSHFRHIYPILIPFITLLCAHLEMIRLRPNRPLFMTAAAACMGFAVASVYLIVYEII